MYFKYTISVTIPIKKVNFSETPSKRDFKKFAEEVFEAYTNIIVEALEARMNACVNGLIKHSDDVKYCDSKYNYIHQKIWWRTYFLL